MNKSLKHYLTLFVIYFVSLFAILYFVVYNIIGVILFSSIGSIFLTGLSIYLMLRQNNQKSVYSKLFFILFGLLGLYTISLYLTTVYYYYEYINQGLSVLEKIMFDFDGLYNIFLKNLPDIFQSSLTNTFFLIIPIILYLQYIQKHKFYGIEKGSSKWSTSANRNKFFLNKATDVDKEFSAFIEYLKEKHFFLEKYYESPILLENKFTLIESLENKLDEFISEKERLNKLISKNDETFSSNNKKTSKEALLLKEEKLGYENSLNEIVSYIEETQKQLSFLYDIKEFDNILDVKKQLDLVKAKITLYDKPIIETHKKPSFFNKIFSVFMKPQVDEILPQINNFILSDTEHLPKDPNKINRNTNMLIVGGAGTGKSRGFVTPNIAQLNNNFIVTDPKGELYRQTSQLLTNNGYIVSVLNLSEPNFSTRYNPFKYIHRQTDIALLVDIIMKNTQGDGEKADFWYKAEKALLTSLAFFCYAKYKEKTSLLNIYDFLIRIRYTEPKPGEIATSILEEEMENLERIDPTNPALANYLVFQQQPVKQRSLILSSLSIRISIFALPEIRQLTETDDFDLEDIECKRAFFVIMSDSVAPYNLIASLFFSQMLNILYYLADFKYRGRLLLQHQFILDEFANIGQIPNFSEILSTCRGRGIGISIILQDLGQIEHLYKDNYKTIISNCDTFLFLGTNELNTCKYISEIIGDTTFKMKNVSYTGAKKQVRYSVEKRRLITPEELKILPNELSIIFIRGLSPFLSNKYNFNKHKYASFLSNKSNHTDIYNAYRFMRKPISERLKLL